MMEYGLIGGKLGHSLSPKIHKLFFDYTGINASYNLYETEASELPSLFKILKGKLAGSNVTVPHKLNIMPLLDSISDESRAIGAVNTVKFSKEGNFGYNTDYFGFKRLIQYNKIAIDGKSVVVLGSGGAARAVVKCLFDMGAEKIYIYSISEISPDFFEIAPMSVPIDYSNLLDLEGDLLINCTPVGMYPNIDVCPIPQSVSSKFDASVDVIYNPVRTVFLQQAVNAGKIAVNGLFMLVAQAVASQEIWQNTSYDSELILKIMNRLSSVI